MDHEVNIETVRHDTNPLVIRTTETKLVVMIVVIQDTIAIETIGTIAGIEADMHTMFH